MFNLSKAEDALKSALKVLLNDKLIQGKTIILDYFCSIDPLHGQEKYSCYGSKCDYALSCRKVVNFFAVRLFPHLYLIDIK